MRSREMVPHHAIALLALCGLRQELQNAFFSSSRPTQRCSDLMTLSGLTIVLMASRTALFSLCTNQMAAQHVYAQQQLERRGAVLLGVTLSECRPIRLSFHESYCVCMHASQCECRRHPPTHRPEPVSRGSRFLACQWSLPRLVCMATHGPCFMHDWSAAW